MAVLQYVVIGDIGQGEVPVGEIVGYVAGAAHLNASQESVVSALVGENTLDIADDKVVAAEDIGDLLRQETTAVFAKRRCHSGARTVEGISAHYVAHASYCDITHDRRIR
jgi:hypothetical protein